MPRIRCHYINCVFLDDGYCSAVAVEIDPDEGCMTFQQASDLLDDDDLPEDDEWEEIEYEDEDDDLWLDDDEEF